MLIRHHLFLVFLLTLIFKFSRQFSEETVKFSIAEGKL
ncbi:Protein CBG26053 [Caenorhabditis briggsae]|uniref:Protein CBG26053 n=1 Tax=Caenorhabditis briggsae TaxID=6238 RepID=B6IEE7_CAEBR|nr:Protein CBG26053 [Caenorhabditis briggsae]CAR98277.1 Protein CBG26053 [Caenorhabditis briggsae]